MGVFVVRKFNHVSVEDQLTGEYGGKERRDDPDEHRNGKSLDRSGTVNEENDRGGGVRHVGIENRAERFLESGLDRGGDAPV